VLNNVEEEHMASKPDRLSSVRLIVVCGAALLGPTAALAGRELDDVKPSIAVIDGKHGHGSGFVILPNVVATNAHVVRDEQIEDVLVRFISNSGAETDPLKVQLLFEDKGRDLALLLVLPHTERRPLKMLTTFEPGPGKQIFIVGNPGQVGNFSRVNALAAGTADEIVMFDKKPFFLIKAAAGKDMIDVGPGSSGGPVLDHSGQVIGIVAAGIMESGKPTGKTFCIPAHALKLALDGLGPPSEWKDRTRIVHTKHLLDIAAVQLYLNAGIARAVLDVRAELARQGHFSNIERVLQHDRQIIELFKAADKGMQDLAHPAFNAILASKDLPTALTNDLRKMRSYMNNIRATVAKGRVSPSAYKQCRQDIEQCDKCWEHVKKETGLTDRLVNEMLEPILASLNGALGRN
jgi:hypothetical protein